MTHPTRFVLFLIVFRRRCISRKRATFANVILTANNMKKLYTIAAFVVLSTGAFAQITADSTCIVPQYMQGRNGTNNDRVPIYFWAELSGLTPGATYRYFTAMDTLGSSPTSNGAGNALLINAASGTFRRVSTTPSLANNATHDSITASNTGTFAGWFGIEPTANNRFTPGTMVHPQLNMNNGAGGTSVANRVKLSNFLIRVLSFDTASTVNACSALYDSIPPFIGAPKNIVLLYDNNSGSGRPLASAVLEQEGINQSVVTSYANFYADSVDQFAQHWGTIMPNVNANGVRMVEYRDLVSGAVLNNSMTDNNGLWCSGANTVNPNNGSSPLYLDEDFTLAGTMTFTDTTFTSFFTQFTANSNGAPGTQYFWDFGDGSPLDTNQNPLYAYSTPGTYTVTLTIQAPSCGIAITDTIVVLLFTGTQEGNIGNTFTLAPNPSDGLFTLNTQAAGMKAVSVVNLLGETVFESNTAEQNLFIDLREKARGVYFVNMTNEKGERTTAKLVVR